VKRGCRPPASTPHLPPSNAPGATSARRGVRRLAGRRRNEARRFENRFDTVVDCAFYHVFSDQSELQRAYIEALHGAIKPGARLYMVEVGNHIVNGSEMARSLSEDDFRQVLPGRRLADRLPRPTGYQGNIGVDTVERMAARNPEGAGQMKPLIERIRVLAPWLVDGRVHVPFWEVHAGRVG
jgi:hypothetical protein